VVLHSVLELTRPEDINRAGTAGYSSDELKYINMGVRDKSADQRKQKSADVEADAVR
jgi:hypothetical protein